MSDFETDIVLMESAQRGYMNTLEWPYLDEYQNRLPVLPKELASIESELRMCHVDEANIQALASLVRQKLIEMQQVLEIAKADGTDAGRARMKDNEGRRLMQQIRTQVVEIRRQIYYRSMDEMR